MSLKSAVLSTNPTSYWPLDDASGNMHDECGLREGVPSGVNLSAVPFGAVRMPYFDGQLGHAITIQDHERYSHQWANALTVACWIGPVRTRFPAHPGHSYGHNFLMQ